MSTASSKDIQKPRKYSDEILIGNKKEIQPLIKKEMVRSKFGDYEVILY